MNQTELENLFDFYNSSLFDNILCSEIAVEFSDLSHINYYGLFDKDDGIIDIHCELDKIEIKQTLIHEMIHVWQWEQYKQLNHKKRFVAKADELGKIVGFTIPIYIDDNLLA